MGCFGVLLSPRRCHLASLDKSMMVIRSVKCRESRVANVGSPYQLLISIIIFLNLSKNNDHLRCRVYPFLQFSIHPSQYPTMALIEQPPDMSEELEKAASTFTSNPAQAEEIYRGILSRKAG